MGPDLFGAHVPRPALGRRTNVVACASNTHFHVLGNLGGEISFRVFRTGLPSVQLFKSRDESLKPVCFSWQFHLSLPGGKIIIHLLGQRKIKSQVT